MYLGGGNLSESEAEDDPDVSRVTLPQGVTSRGNMPSEQSSVRLVELGPRMTMKLVKIEEGMHDGDILYHRWVQKTDEEKREIKIAREKRRKEKEKRKREQDQNVKKKEQNKEQHKQKSLEGMMKKKLQKMKDSGEEVPAQFQGEIANEEAEKIEGEEEPYQSEDEADEDWYRKEVGEEPEKDLFGGDNNRKRSATSSNLDVRFKKRMKKATDSNSRSRSSKLGNTTQKHVKRDTSYTKGSVNKKSEPKWKFKAGRSQDNKSSKRDSFSKDKKNFGKGKTKSSTRVFNSEGVGPNYKKAPSGKRKKYDSIRSNKGKKHR